MANLSDGEVLSEDDENNKDHNNKVSLILLISYCFLHFCFCLL